jgi:hypothetical protein
MIMDVTGVTVMKTKFELESHRAYRDWYWEPERNSMGDRVSICARDLRGLWHIPEDAKVLEVQFYKTDGVNRMLVEGDRWGFTFDREQRHGLVGVATDTLHELVEADYKYAELRY